MTHLPSGRVCLLPERHSGGCVFSDQDAEMTPLTVSAAISTQLLRRAAVRATLAPSVHNTQPWRLVLNADSLEIHADQSRRLRVLDPDGREMVISCGCAVFNARACIAGAGYQPLVERYPDPHRPSLLARITVDDSASQAEDISDIGDLDAFIELRRTNRRRFSHETVPDDVVEQLIAAALLEQSVLRRIDRPDDRIKLAVLAQRADTQQESDPAYRAELQSWTHNEPGRTDGVPAMVVPRNLPPDSDPPDADLAHDDVPIRDFDTRGAGALPAETRSGLDQCLLLLGSTADNPEAWLRAGEALERVQLEVARHGYAVSPITQLMELTSTRAMLRAELGLSMQPHVLLRIGRAPHTPATRRRRLVDVLLDAV